MPQSLARIQAPYLAQLRPGQLLGFKFNRAKMNWRIRASGDFADSKQQIASVRAALEKCEKLCPNMFEVAKNTKPDVFSAYFYTPAKFVDVIEITLKSEGDVLVATAYSGSTSMCPSTVPFACVFGLLLACVPFLDHYENIKHLYFFVELLEREGFDVEVETLMSGSGLVKEIPTSSGIPLLKEPNQLQQ